MSDIEQEIQDKGLTGPRVTMQDVEDAIVSEHYFTADRPFYATAAKVKGCETDRIQLAAVYKSAALEQLDMINSALERLTFCVLVLRNGFTVTGESSCVSPENFDAEIGRKIARQNAVAKIWPLMGYALRDKLHTRSQYGEAEG